MRNAVSGSLVVGCAMIVSIATVYPTYAGPFDNLLGGGAPAGSQGATVSAEELDKQLTALNTRFMKSLVAMIVAQSLTSEALGQREEADKWRMQAAELEGKSDINAVVRAIEISNSASESINEKKRNEKIEDAQARKHIINAVPYYAVGVANAAKLPGEYQSWAKNAEAIVSGMKSNPLSAMSAGGLAGDLADVLDVTSKLPNLISTWSTTTSNFIDLAKTNKVDTKGLASKI